MDQDLMSDEDKQAAIKSYLEAQNNSGPQMSLADNSGAPSQAPQIDLSQANQSDSSQSAPSPPVSNDPKLDAIKAQLAQQYATANDDTDIKTAMANAHHANNVANFGSALESIAKANSMAHGGAGVDNDFYQGLRQQGQQGIQQAQTARNAKVQQFIQQNEINRQVATDTMAKGTYDQQQKAAKYLNDQEDPTSAVSKNAQTAFTAAFKSMPEVANMDVSNFSASDLASASKNVDVIAKLNELKQAKQMQLEFQKGMLGNKQDQKMQANEVALNNRDINFRGNTAAQQAQQGILNADKALDIISKVPDPNNIPPQMVNLIAQEVSKIAAGGVGSEFGQKTVQAETLQSRWNEMMQRVNGQPTGADLGPFVNMYKNYLQGMKATNSTYMDKYYQDNLAGNMGGQISSDAIERYKAKHPTAFPSASTGSTGGQGNGQGAGQTMMAAQELPPDPTKLVKDTLYKLKNGKTGTFNGKGFTPYQPQQAVAGQ